MADYINRVNRLWIVPTCLLLTWFCWLLVTSSARAGDSFTVRPVKQVSDLRLLPAQGWPPPGGDPGANLLKLSYLRGLIDALQYAEVAPETAGKSLQALQGLDLVRLAAAIDKYYAADPRRRELPPAAVFFRILPLEFERPGSSAPQKK